jgi:GcrA cell cycle regulator
MSCASFPRDGSPWTDQRTQRLTDLWRAGKSAREVADALGVTRNAVIGKLHRLGLSGDPAHASAGPSKPRRERRPRAVVVRSPATRRQAFVCQAEALPGLARHLEDLSRRACRWPIGDPKSADFAFCGRPAEAQPYCAVHQAVAVAPRRKGR